MYGPLSHGLLAASRKNRLPTREKALCLVERTHVLTDPGSSLPLLNYFHGFGTFRSSMQSIFQAFRHESQNLTSVTESLKSSHSAPLFRLVTCRYARGESKISKRRGLHAPARENGQE